MPTKSLSEGFFSFWICTLWPISITLAFNITRITNQVSPWVVLWLWKKQVLFPSTHMGNYYNMKYAHGDGQGGTGGECNNLRQNRVRAHGTQFIQTRRVEQTLGLPCKAPLSKPAFRHEEWKRTGVIKAKSKTCMTFPGRRILMQGSCRTRYNRQVWRDAVATHTMTVLCSRVTYSGLMRTFTDVKIQPSHKPDPTKSRCSTKSTLKARRISCLPKSTLSWGLHITHHSLSWAGAPHPHSKQNPAVPIHLKDPCSFSRAHFHLIIKKVNNIADLMESASSVRFIGRQ